MTDTHATIFTGGDAPDRRAATFLGTQRLVIAADGGWHHARAIGCVPDVLVGDMDSISAEGLAAAAEAGIEVIRHRADKDNTDTELAVDLALDRGATTLTIVSGGGDRLDHILGFLHAVASRASSTVTIDLFIGAAYVAIVPAGTRRRIAVGESALVSLIPIGGPASGVRTENLKWHLTGDTLEVFSSRGVSNEALGNTIEIGLDTGILAVIQPYFFGDSPATTQEI